MLSAWTLGQSPLEPGAGLGVAGTGSESSGGRRRRRKSFAEARAKAAAVGVVRVGGSQPPAGTTVSTVGSSQPEMVVSTQPERGVFGGGSAGRKVIRKKRRTGF